MTTAGWRRSKVGLRRGNTPTPSPPAREALPVLIEAYRRKVAECDRWNRQWDALAEAMGRDDETAQALAYSARAVIDELVAALTDMTQLVNEVSGIVEPEQCRFLSLDCDGGQHNDACPMVAAGRALTRAAALRARMEG